ncbi:hypothetical protein SAMN05428947_101643 [Mucilaginibacter sp. OK283]|jgi:hypothetical protein|nr:hypothetical protein SAMN05428947_101643 [Mucilaginibacter sp. OK283]
MWIGKAKGLKHKAKSWKGYRLYAQNLFNVLFKAKALNKKPYMLSALSFLLSALLSVFVKAE